MNPEGRRKGCGGLLNYSDSDHGWEEISGVQGFSPGRGNPKGVRSHPLAREAEGGERLQSAAEFTLRNVLFCDLSRFHP